jgi:hypothetical protein
MTLGSDNNGARSGKAERLRGGCVPCPVCTVSHVYVRLLTCLSGRKCVLDHPHSVLLLLGLVVALGFGQPLISHAVITYHGLEDF